jgi:hypothetical protein
VGCIATYCRECIYEFRREQGRRESQDCSHAPPPPPGFVKRDLHAGRPYDSAYTRDDEWLDGDRPGHFEARQRSM